MITSKDLFIEDGKLYIAVAASSMGFRGFELSSQRPPALLYQDGAFQEIDWLGTRIEHKDRCLCLDASRLGPTPPIPAVELAGTLRNDAFMHLARLAKALEAIDGTKGIELDRNFCALPLSSMYFTQDAVLLLPSKASALIDAMIPDEDRAKDREAWYVHEEANGFGRAKYLFQLLYYAITGTIPFGVQDVKDTGYKPIPLGLYFTNDEGHIQNAGVAELCSNVDKALSMARKEMYKVGNPYEYFLSTLSKTVGSITPNDCIATNSKVYKEYLLKLGKKARIRRFLRKKGAALAASIAGAAIVVSIAWYYVALALTPPTTAGLPKDEIVRAYYKAVNDLDIQGVNDSLARGCKSPDEMTVTNLEVTQKVRYAYEGENPIVEAQAWLDEGRPAIPQGSMVYGITNLDIELTGEMEAVASFDFIRPYENYEQEGGTTTSLYIPTGVYHDIVRFSFVQKKHWLEISVIEILEETLQEIHEIPYGESGNAVSTMVLRSDPF